MVHVLYDFGMIMVQVDDVVGFGQSTNYYLQIQNFQ